MMELSNVSDEPVNPSIDLDLRLSHFKLLADFSGIVKKLATQNHKL